MRKSDALPRLRTNALTLVTIVILTHLLPVPSLLDAFRRRDSVITLLELLAVALLSFNILHSLISLSFPSTPSARSAVKASVKPLATPKRRPLNGLISSANSPTSSSLGSSTSLNLSAASPHKSSYAASPLSTPSRLVHYSTSSSTPLNASLNSSWGPKDTPSPYHGGGISPIKSNIVLGEGSGYGGASPLAVFRGRGGGLGDSASGRPIEGAFLNSLRRGDDEHDE